VNRLQSKGLASGSAGGVGAESRLPAPYLPLLAVSLLISLLGALDGSMTALVGATFFAGLISLSMLAMDGLIMWRRGGIVGRLTLTFGLFYWFWLGAMQIAADSQPFAPQIIYPGFLVGVPEWIVGYGLIGVHLFAIAMLIGWRWAPQPRRSLGWLADRYDAGPSGWIDLVSLALVLASWVSVYIAYQGALGTAFQDMLMMRSSGKSGPTQEVGLLHHLHLLGIFGASLALSRVVMRLPGIFWARVMAIMLMFPIAYLSTGTRFNFAYTMLPAILVLMAPAGHRMRWQARRWILAIVVVLGVVLVLFQGAVRSTGVVDYFTKDRSEFIEVMETGLVGHDQFTAMLVAIDFIDYRGEFYNELMVPFFVTHFVPSRFWPDKPFPASWKEYNEAWTQHYQFNVTPSVTGQYYLNWGFPGIVAIGLFFGWLARFCECWFQRLDIRQQMLSATVAGLLLGFLFLSFRFFYPLYFAYPLFGFLAYWIVSKRRRKGRPAPQIAVPPAGRVLGNR